MSIFKSIKEAVVNTTTNVADFTRGIGSNLIDVTADNRVRVTQAIANAKETGKANRIKSQAEKIMKKLKKLQKAQAELEAKGIYTEPNNEAE